MMKSTNPKPASAPVLLKNVANAPVVYFDGVPTYGLLAGVVQLELAASVIFPRADGTVGSDAICVAHLRCSVNAARNLSAALDKALDMAEAAQQQVEVEAAVTRQ